MQPGAYSFCNSQEGSRAGTVNVVLAATIDRFTTELGSHPIRLARRHPVLTATLGTAPITLVFAAGMVAGGGWFAFNLDLAVTAILWPLCYFAVVVPSPARRAHVGLTAGLFTGLAAAVAGNSPYWILVNVVNFAVIVILMGYVVAYVAKTLSTVPQR